MNHWHIYLLAYSRWCNICKTCFFLTISIQTCDRLCYSWTRFLFMFSVCLKSSIQMCSCRRPKPKFFQMWGRACEVSCGNNRYGGLGAGVCCRSFEFVRELKRKKRGMKMVLDTVWTPQWYYELWGVLQSKFTIVRLSLGETGSTNSKTPVRH